MQAPARMKLGRRGELLSNGGPAGVSFVISAYMLAVKRGVEWCFQQSHPWIFAEAEAQTQLIDQINVLFMRLFDPDCLYASFGALEASERAIKLWRKLGVVQASIGSTPARRMINQEYRVTPLMALLMAGDGAEPGNAKTRVLLAKAKSDPMILHQEHDEPSERVPLEGWRRAALFRSANKRISSLSKAAPPTEDGKSEKAKTAGFMKTKRTKVNTRSGTHSSGGASTVGSESETTMHTTF